MACARRACHAVVSGGGREGELCCAEAGRCGVHRICIGSSEAGALSRASDTADGLCDRADVVGWLVDDQREASGRTDVLTFTSDKLTAPVKISGQPMANLIASTSGGDSDWVVKLIDVYPDEVAGQPNMGGYQLMIAGDIFRGRYRESLEKAKAIAPNQPLLYRFALPKANHVFLPGHRIMVQVQSSWFPLYDRNPQTFVPNIFLAKPADYQKAVERVYHSSGQASFVELPVVDVH